MKRIEFARCIALRTLLVVVLSGCAANMATRLAADGITANPVGAPQQYDTAQTSRPTTSSADARKVAPGMTIHIDPTTGEFLPEPAADGVSKQAADAVTAPVLQLKAVPSPTLGGGIMIDLQGQFRMPLMATMGADGKLTMKHESTIPTPETEGK